ncbi:hypothetical protein F5Y09DRAFT_354498 [Xylaria sp. FL1042]|nr:hypothetical protein F5Y09DRAFT_354498 [Xylaria sp. FL1042]
MESSTESPVMSRSLSEAALKDFPDLRNKEMTLATVIIVIIIVVMSIMLTLMTFMIVATFGFSNWEACVTTWIDLTMEPHVQDVYFIILLRAIIIYVPAQTDAKRQPWRPLSWTISELLGLDYK